MADLPISGFNPVPSAELTDDHVIQRGGVNFKENNQQLKDLMFPSGNNQVLFNDDDGNVTSSPNFTFDDSSPSSSLYALTSFNYTLTTSIHTINTSSYDLIASVINTTAVNTIVNSSAYNIAISTYNATCNSYEIFFSNAGESNEFSIKSNGKYTQSFEDTTQALDEKRWAFTNDGNSFQFEAQTDLGVSSDIVYFITRNGGTTDAVHYFTKVNCQGGLACSQGSFVVGTLNADASAIVDVVSTTKGSRPIPRMTEAQRDLIPSPATALQIDNITTNAINRYNGTIWETLGSTSLPTGNNQVLFNDGSGNLSTSPNFTFDEISSIYSISVTTFNETSNIFNILSNIYNIETGPYTITANTITMNVTNSIGYNINNYFYNKFDNNPISGLDETITRGRGTSETPLASVVGDVVKTVSYSGLDTNVVPRIGATFETKIDDTISATAVPISGKFRSFNSDTGLESSWEFGSNGSMNISGRNNQIAFTGNGITFLGGATFLVIDYPEVNVQNCNNFLLSNSGDFKYTLSDTSQALDEKQWSIMSDAGDFKIVTLFDDGSTGDNVLEAFRTGTTVTQVAIGPNATNRFSVNSNGTAQLDTQILVMNAVEDILYLDTISASYAPKICYTVQTDDIIEIGDLLTADFSAGDFHVRRILTTDPSDIPVIGFASTVAVGPSTTVEMCGASIFAVTSDSVTTFVVGDGVERSDNDNGKVESGGFGTGTIGVCANAVGPNTLFYVWAKRNGVGF